MQSFTCAWDVSPSQHETTNRTGFSHLSVRQSHFFSDCFITQYHILNRHPQNTFPFQKNVRFERPFLSTLKKTCVWRKKERAQTLRSVGSSLNSRYLLSGAEIDIYRPVTRCAAARPLPRSRSEYRLSLS